VLVERTFAIGGWVCLTGAVVLAAAFVRVGAVGADPLVLLTPGMLGGFGGFFLWVSVGARTERIRLLELAEEPERPPR
jgi:hypothetical protein